MLKKFTAVLTALLMSAHIPVLAQTQFTIDDYNLALRMALKFFGGQRCGNTHNWMLVDNPNAVGNSCHLGDKYNGHDVTGGWHDCGDHIKVATTMGYAAVSLLTAYDVWPKAFEDNHSQTYGPPNGIADVLDEVKIATDFFMKSFPDENTFVYYVGDGSYDHQEWVTSAKQSGNTVEKGGDPRPSYAASDKGGAQAANYASALALMAMRYPDKEYAAVCSTAAVRIHKFARQYPDNISIPEFYASPNSEVSDEHALMCILLYRLTGKETYKTEAFTIMKNKWESNSALAWDTVADILYYYLAKVDPAADNGNHGHYSDFLRKNVQSGITGANSYGIPWGWLTSNWGTNKLASGNAFAAALYVNLVDSSALPEGTTSAASARAYNKKIIDYMLGANEWTPHPFIHGFKGDMHFRVHHRNAMGRDDNPPTDVKNSAPFLFPSGALIGGPATQGVFENKIEGGAAYVETESGCDYNAPFVAAIANIVAALDPKEVISGEPPVVSIKNNVRAANSRALPSVKLTGRGLTVVSHNGSNSYARAEIFNASGKKVYASAIDKTGNGSPFNKPLPTGLYIVRLRGAGATDGINLAVLKSK
jgi:hypothetical protein